MSFSWIKDLPEIQGRYVEKAKMSDHTWFRVGGEADVLFRPKDEDDLIHFLKNKPKGIPVTVLGAGSNVLVRDGGVPGIVIRLLGKGFSQAQWNKKIVEVGAGCLDRVLALSCIEQGVGGLEFLVGIPGTIGGAVRMNAGAYGREIKDVLVWAECVDADGNKHRVTPQDLGFEYRHSQLHPSWIVTKACLKGELKDPSEIEKQIKLFLAEREASQPTKGRTGGSTFKNPSSGKAWELIDQAGCRGLQHGGAEVSQKHCNFLLNTGTATAADLEGLAEEVRHCVKNTSNIDLEWEIIRLGR